VRYINLNTLLTQIYADDHGKKARARLDRAQVKVARKRTLKTRKRYIDKSGNDKWRPIKDRLVSILGKKCWYTVTGHLKTGQCWSLENRPL
jgi:hypothetical protein